MVNQVTLLSRATPAANSCSSARRHWGCGTLIGLTNPITLSHVLLCLPPSEALMPAAMNTLCTLSCAFTLLISDCVSPSWPLDSPHTQCILSVSGTDDWQAKASGECQNVIWMPYELLKMGEENWEGHSSHSHTACWNHTFCLRRPMASQCTEHALQWLIISNDSFAMPIVLFCFSSCHLLMEWRVALLCCCWQTTCLAISMSLVSLFGASIPISFSNL